MAALSSWHDYFMTVGAGAAALTGLVFVAMTLHLEEITQDPVHRHRARSILAGLTAVFIRCALVLMGGQNNQAVAVELIGVLLWSSSSSCTPASGRPRTAPTAWCCCGLLAALPAWCWSRPAPSSFSSAAHGAFTRSAWA